MNEHKFREYIYWGVTAVSVIVCCILVAMIFLRWNTVRAAIHSVNVILAPITYGAILAYLLTPLQKPDCRLSQVTASFSGFPEFHEVLFP